MRGHLIEQKVSPRERIADGVAVRAVQGNELFDFAQVERGVLFLELLHGGLLIFGVEYPAIVQVLYVRHGVDNGVHLGLLDVVLARQVELARNQASDRVALRQLRLAIDDQVGQLTER